MTKSGNLVRKALIAAHKVLLEDLQALDDASRAIPLDRALLGRLLEKAGTDVSEHFHFEEQDGYMKAVRDRQPHRQREIELLQQEHAQLKDALEALYRETVLEMPLHPEFGKRIRDWLRSMRRHEARENELVQDAFNLDVIGED